MSSEEVKKKIDGGGLKDNYCASANAKQLWAVGITLVVIVTIFAVAMFRTNGASSVHGGVTQMHQVAMQQPLGYRQCPSCNYLMQAPVSGNGGVQQCPNCLQPMSMGLRGLGAPQPLAFSQAVVPPACATCQGINRIAPQGQQVALTKTMAAPPITKDALMPHGYRGVCSNCHVIVRPSGPVK